MLRDLCRCVVIEKLKKLQREIADSGWISPGSRYNWLKKKPLKTADLEVISRKDLNGWIYKLAEGKKLIGTASSKLDISNGQTVEVGYELKYPNKDRYKLRFPKILRVREDKWKRKSLDPPFKYG